MGYRLCPKQTWGDYIINVIDYDYLLHARLQLRLRINKITMYSITITFESNHDYNRDYIYLETFSEKKNICVVSGKYNFRQRTI